MQPGSGSRLNGALPDGGDAFRFVVVFHQPSVVVRAIRVIVEG